MFMFAPNARASAGKKYDTGRYRQANNNVMEDGLCLPTLVKN